MCSLTTYPSIQLHKYISYSMVNHGLGRDRTGHSAVIGGHTRPIVPTHGCERTSQQGI
jgi:hypothetical protein